MDEWLVAGVAVVLAVALAGAVWFLVVRCLRDRCSRIATTHVFRGQGQAVTVAELLEEAAERGEPIRLNWPDDLNEAGPIRPYKPDQFPTAILPKIEDFDDQDELYTSPISKWRSDTESGRVRPEDDRQEDGS